MKLIFSRYSLLNAVLRDAQGSPLYRIETSHSWSNRSTTISRFVAGPHAQIIESNRAHPLVEVAEIRWHAVKQSVFVFKGMERKLGDYLRGKGLMRRQRIFTATDGRSYKWILGMRTCWSSAADLEIEVARYHRPSVGLVGKAHTGWLEYLPQVEPILHELIMTFVWVERRRKQRERAA
ncbi:hypothetical protein OF83DRAFT_1035037, partial [Amylostereum chailletii]